MKQARSTVSATRQSAPHRRPRWPTLCSIALAGLLSTALAGGTALAQAARDGVLPLSAFPRERIAIETRKNFRRDMFVAWRAETPRTREQGLMFVRDDQMRPDEAMIFVYDPPEYVAMWMKNTLLPLDMLFVDPRGCVVTIKQGAKPGSLDTIGSAYPVSLVVELKAGVVAKHGIAIGDRVLRVDAGWPAQQEGSCR